MFPVPCLNCTELEHPWYDYNATGYCGDQQLQFAVALTECDPATARSATVRFAIDCPSPDTEPPSTSGPTTPATVAVSDSFESAAGNHFSFQQWLFIVAAAGVLAIGQ